MFDNWVIRSVARVNAYSIQDHVKAAAQQISAKSTRKKSKERYQLPQRASCVPPSRRKNTYDRDSLGMLDCPIRGDVIYAFKPRLTARSESSGVRLSES